MARPVNHDRKINDLLGQLRRALVAKEQARIEETVALQMAGLVAGLGKGAAVVAAPAAPARTAAAPVAKKRKGWSAEAKAKARARMVAYWKARRAKEGKRVKGAAAGSANA